MLRRRFCAVLLGALALAACAPANIAPDKLAGIRRVAVVSLIGHELNQVYIGFTVFGNERERYDIRSWKLDAAYEEQAAAALRAIGRVEAVQAPVDREAFMPLHAGRGGPINPDLIDPDWAAVAGPLRELAGRTRADAVIVALVRLGPDHIGRSPQSIKGIGIYARGAGSTTHIAVAHVDAALYAVDPVALKTLATRGLVFRRDYDVRPSYVPIDKALARTPFPEWTPGQQAQAREKLLEAVAPAWESTLREMLSGK